MRVFGGGVRVDGSVSGGADGRAMRDWRGDREGNEWMNGVSRFWETVPKAGRFFCAIVELKGSRSPEFEYRRYNYGI